MFGRHKHQTDEDEEVSVDATLELDLGTAEESIEAYLKDPSVDLRNELLAVLERLDQQIDRSDAYEEQYRLRSVWLLGQGLRDRRNKQRLSGRRHPGIPTTSSGGLDQSGKTRSHGTDAQTHLPTNALLIKPCLQSGAKMALKCPGTPALGLDGSPPATTKLTGELFRRQRTQHLLLSGLPPRWRSNGNTPVRLRVQ